MYAKIVNNILTPAPRSIVVDGARVYNPTEKQLLAVGYKPVIYTEPTEEAPDGWMWVSGWAETAETIVQNWELVEKPIEEPSVDELLSIILTGGAT